MLDILSRAALLLILFGYVTPTMVVRGGRMMGTRHGWRHDDIA